MEKTKRKYESHTGLLLFDWDYTRIKLYKQAIIDKKMDEVDRSISQKIVKIMEYSTVNRVNPFRAAKRLIKEDPGDNEGAYYKAAFIEFNSIEWD